MHPLREYLKRTGQPLGKFAEKVGTTSAYLCHIMATPPRKTPGDDLIEAIIRESGGRLTYRDFKPKKAAQLERIKELEATNA